MTDTETILEAADEIESRLPKVADVIDPAVKALLWEQYNLADIKELGKQVI